LYERQYHSVWLRAALTVAHHKTTILHGIPSIIAESIELADYMQSWIGCWYGKSSIQ